MTGHLTIFFSFRYSYLFQGRIYKGVILVPFFSKENYSFPTFLNCILKHVKNHQMILDQIEHKNGTGLLYNGSVYIERGRKREKGEANSSLNEDLREKIEKSLQANRGPSSPHTPHILNCPVIGVCYGFFHFLKLTVFFHF